MLVFFRPDDVVHERNSAGKAPVRRPGGLRARVPGLPLEWAWSIKLRHPELDRACHPTGSPCGRPAPPPTHGGNKPDRHRGAFLVLEGGCSTEDHVLCLRDRLGFPGPATGRLLALRMSTPLSAWASDEGRCHARPSGRRRKSSLNAKHTAVGSDGLAPLAPAFECLGAEAVRVGRPVEEHRVLLMLLRHVPHRGRRRSTIVGRLDVLGQLLSTSLLHARKRLNLELHQLGEPHGALQGGAGPRMTERPE